MTKILIVEDDRDLGEGLILALRGIDAVTILCQNLRDARAVLTSDNINLAILDVNLPDGSGLDLLREIKRKNPIPVILLTADDTEMDVVRGLEHGADDYVTKPFSLAILRARVNARMRGEKEPVAPPIKVDRFVFDFGRMEFTADNKPVELSKTEQKLLKLLVENRGITLTRDRLLDLIWGDSAGTEFVVENALSVAVKRLRDKLGAADCIKTVYGVGYTWGVNE
jgi:DNA-binding response OmpR family regulator